MKAHIQMRPTQNTPESRPVDRLRSHRSRRHPRRSRRPTACPRASTVHRGTAGSFEGGRCAGWRGGTPALASSMSLPGCGVGVLVCETSMHGWAIVHVILCICMYTCMYMCLRRPRTCIYIYIYIYSVFKNAFRCEFLCQKHTRVDMCKDTCVSV